jgi:hypothetical protein
MLHTARRAEAQELSPPSSITIVVSTFKQRDAWSRMIAKHPLVKLMHRHVLRSLALCARINDEGGLVIDPTYKALAKAARCSDRTAKRAVAVGEEIRIVRKVRQSDGRVSNGFGLLLPEAGSNGDKKPCSNGDKFPVPTVTNFTVSAGANGDTAVTVLRVKRKTELKDRVPNTTKSAVRRDLIDRVPMTPREETPVADTPLQPAKTSAVDAPLITPETTRDPEGRVTCIRGKERKPTNTTENESKKESGARANANAPRSPDGAGKTELLDDEKLEPAAPLTGATVMETGRTSKRTTGHLWPIATPSPMTIARPLRKKI